MSESAMKFADPDEDKREYMRRMFDVCETDAERRGVFMSFAMDTGYARSDICLVLKELGINDDMSLRRQP